MKGFNYDKYKNQASGGDGWGSYSDLFMVLSFIFLMMYVTASLRSGANSIQQHIANKKTQRENDDLRAQIKAYDALKDETLKSESEEEQQVYEQLMDKLTLLQDQAKDEKIKLRKQALENEQKEMALNKYQQVVRNIINANMLAKSKLKVRGEIIDKKNVVISDLNTELTEKKQIITKNTFEINQINSELTKKIDDLNKAEKDSKITKEKAYAQIARLKKESEEKITKLSTETQVAQEQISQIKNQLESTEQKLAQESMEKEKISARLDQTTQEYETQIKTLQENHDTKMARERAEFEKKLTREKISRAEKQKQLAAFNKAAKEKDEQVAKQLQNLKSDLENSKERLAREQREKEGLSAKLTQTTSEYEAQMKSLQQGHEAKMARERAAFEGKIAAEKMSASEKQRQLAAFNKAAKLKDEQVARQLQNLKSDLENSKGQLAIEQKEKEGLSAKLAQTTAEYEAQVKSLQQGHEAKMARERAAFENKIAAEKLSGSEKEKQLAAFNKAAKEKDDQMARQLRNLKDDLEKSRNVATREIASLKGDLAEAEAKANARAKLAKEIANSLKKAGVTADVNTKTGDVTVSFGEDYFDNDSAQLKGTMAEVLRKFIPLYSENLFKDKNIADKITSVEILGYASPTYKSKYVDPHSLDPEDQKAAKYNLDLSYKRARSIFDYIFDKNKIEYVNQKKLLPLVKVAGKSFFSEEKIPDGIAPGMNQREFCRKVDCKKSQKVIIKFNMDDTKVKGMSNE